MEFCIWNENSLFVGGLDKNLKIIDIKYLREPKYLYSINRHTSIDTIKKKIIIIQYSLDGKIVLWPIK